MSGHFKLVEGYGRTSVKMTEQKVIVIGVDACKAGWVFVRLEDGAFVSAMIHKNFADGVGEARDAAVIGVDIPIGFPVDSAQGRAADVEARCKVKPLASSVFPAPHPKILGATNWEMANELSHELIEKGISKQSFALVPKIIEVEEVANQDDRVYEIHPEVSFRELAGDRLASKKTWNGHTRRCALLAKAGIQIPDYLADAGTAAVDDILDAAAAAWSASRIALGVATSLPNPPERGANNRQVAIWY